LQVSKRHQQNIASLKPNDFGFDRQPRARAVDETKFPNPNVRNRGLDYQPDDFLDAPLT
jgi:hypothetical protein